MYEYICTNAYILTQIHTHKEFCIQELWDPGSLLVPELGKLHMYVCKYGFMYVYMHVCTDDSSFLIPEFCKLHMYVCMYLCMCTCMFVQMIVLF